MLCLRLRPKSVNLLAVAAVTMLVGFAACGSDDQTKAQGDAGSEAGGEGGGGTNVAGSQATSGTAATGDGGAALGGARSGGDAGAAAGPGSAGDASLGGANLGGSPGAAGDTGAAGAPSCEVGAAQSPAAPGSLDLFGQIAYFGSGDVLPAGRYRVTYVDGCMKYASNQDWAIHAYGDGSIAWWLGSTSGEKLVMLPGTVGIFQDQGGYTDFAACVAANQPLAPLDFDFAGGALGIWLADSAYSDNLAGIDGRNPSWKLTRLGDGCSE
jgi:hypothetical protein